MMEAMPYTQFLLSSGRAIGYHAKAAPPTVTMPRLKAMVSGAIGGFLDVAFNFNTQAFLDDNLLDQFYSIGWKMVMLGDETWIKLFPGLFTRQDGVSSFFVKDTVEVDFNVSRHLEVELAAGDWNLLILHYLGLDHVGHIGRRRSILMAPKLKEMDEVIKMIHTQKILHQDELDKRTLLVVVSDHGMTDGGNHGGSSNEETDSLALFIGGEPMISDYASPTHKLAFQVDVAPTLALLLGVPIPKNNIGVLLLEVLSSLTDKQRLHALELNSWQLLNLLQAHLPGLLCGNLSYRVNDERDKQISDTISDTRERLYHLFSEASAAHNLWKVHQQGSEFTINNTDELKVITSYFDFLRNANEWLSHRATDKPTNLLLSGVAIMVMSCIVLLNLLFCLLKEVFLGQKQSHSQLKEWHYSWHLEEAFVFFGIFVHGISLGSSSMVEEEQYTWHFLASTLYLMFLLIAVQSLLKLKGSSSTEVVKGQEENTLHQLWRTDSCSGDKFSNLDFGLLKNMKDYSQILSILIVLVCGRLLRGWHQGGVNWVDLPDISKWLEEAGVSSIKSLQIISLLLLMIFNSFSIGSIRSKTILVHFVIISHLLSGLLVCLHIMENWSPYVIPHSHNSTSVAQIFYLTVTVTVLVTGLSSPWILPVHDNRPYSIAKPNKDSDSINTQIDPLLLGIRDSMYITGMAYMASWCLLQLLLQQPINSVPTVLIFLQLFASIFYFSANGSCHKQWVEVVALYFLGMSGHFGLGNSNSLATVDVAGAFIGISNHSTVLSGILMFIITHASPVLSFLSMVVYISLKYLRHISCTKDLELGYILRTMIAFPCLLPLVLNSIVLTTFTIVLLLMKDHLFVWSVFSPKYLYICAMTMSVYIGVLIVMVTVIYVITVFYFRGKMLKSNFNTS